MTTRRSPDGQIYTEVPVVPRHDQLDGRSLGNSHPIEAITGLQDALDGKVDAVEGKGLSTEDFTTEEKAKLASYEPSPIRLIKVDGVTQDIDEEGAVDLTMYWEQMGRSIAWDDTTGKLILRNDWGEDLSRAELPRDGVTAAAYDQATGRLVLTLHDGSTVYADLSSLEQEYTAGNGLRLTGRAFALTDAVATAVSEASDHVATDSVHVSAADRAKWNGVDNAVKTSGNQSIAGDKTFTGTVVVPTPTAASQAATKAYVDSVAGGGGGGGSYTAGEGLQLVGDEFSLSSATRTTLAGSVQTSGAQTIAGVKTFSSSPIVPQTPTADGQAASKAYVDGAVSAKADDSAVVKLTGAQTVAGVKTFSSIPKIPTTTPTSNDQVASKAYVDAAVAGGGGSGTTYTAGTGLSLVGTEFSLDSATQTAVGAVASKADDSAVVKLSGAQTVAGVKTFSSSPIVPTPTADYEVATKKYVDDNAGGGGSGGSWTVLQPEEYTSANFNTLFSSDGTTGSPFTTLKDICIVIHNHYNVIYSAYYPKGTHIEKRLSISYVYDTSSTSGYFESLYRITLESLFWSSTSGTVVCTKYNLKGVTNATTTAAAVTGTGEKITYADVVHKAGPAEYSSDKLSLFIQYR